MVNLADKPGLHRRKSWLLKHYNDFMWTYPEESFKGDDFALYNWNMYWTGNTTESFRFWLGSVVLVKDTETELWGALGFKVPDDSTDENHFWWDYPNNVRKAYARIVYISDGSPWKARTHSLLDFNPLSEQLEGIIKLMILDMPMDEPEDR